MTWFDAGALALVALAIADGATSGPVWAACETFVLGGSGALARSLCGPAEPYVGKIADAGPSDLPWITHAVLFGAIAALGFGVLILVHPMTKDVRFRRDAWVGAAVGLWNGLFAAALIGAVVLTGTPRSYDADLSGSVLLRVVRSADAAGLGGTLPEHTAARATELLGA